MMSEDSTNILNNNYITENLLCKLRTSFPLTRRSEPHYTGLGSAASGEVFLKLVWLVVRYQACVLECTENTSWTEESDRRNNITNRGAS
jgi:hypothetical protein